VPQLAERWELPARRRFFVATRPQSMLTARRPCKPLLPYRPFPAESFSSFSPYSFYLSCCKLVSLVTQCDLGRLRIVLVSHPAIPSTSAPSPAVSNFGSPSSCGDPGLTSAAAAPAAQGPRRAPARPARPAHRRLAAHADRPRSARPAVRRKKDLTMPHALLLPRARRRAVVAGVVLSLVAGPRPTRPRRRRCRRRPTRSDAVAGSAPAPPAGADPGYAYVYLNSQGRCRCWGPRRSAGRQLQRALHAGRAAAVRRALAGGEAVRSRSTSSRPASHTSGEVDLPHRRRRPAVRHDARRRRRRGPRSPRRERPRRVRRRRPEPGRDPAELGADPEEGRPAAVPDQQGEVRRGQVRAIPCRRCTRSPG